MGEDKKARKERKRKQREEHRRKKNEKRMQSKFNFTEYDFYELLRYKKYDIYICMVESASILLKTESLKQLSGSKLTWMQVMCYMMSVLMLELIV